MALPQSELLYTIEEYLAYERASEERHEYADGYVYNLAGESPQHGDISVNLVRELSSQLRGSACRTWTKDTKIRSGPMPVSSRRRKGLFSYPDVVVVCGEPEFLDDHQDALVNPRVVIEVLSDRTEAFDRGGKFLRYQQWNPTLTDYLLVSQDDPIIEHYIRRDDGSWSYYSCQGLDQSLTIESINCTLALADVFDRIVFPEENS
jgi:Uma2 family endonuclease